jgi:alpha-tubulin suppressor-like RCC1 family protein
MFWRLRHGDEEDQAAPKRVEALRDVRVSSVRVGDRHAIVLTEEGQVYGWGQNATGRKTEMRVYPVCTKEPLPKPIEALRGVRVVSIAVAALRSYTVTDTSEMWAWGDEDFYCVKLGLDNDARGSLPMVISTLQQQGIKVKAVTTGTSHTLALADDGSVYAWGGDQCDGEFVPCLLGTSAPQSERAPGQKRKVKEVRTPQRVPAISVARGR